MNNMDGTLGEQTTHEGLVVAVVDDGQGACRIQILDGAAEFSSNCARYTQVGIRERAVEWAYGHLLERDGTAQMPTSALLWRRIRSDIEPPARN